MTDYTKENAKFAQEFWERAEECSDLKEIDDLWIEHVLIDGDKADGHVAKFYFGLRSMKFSWKKETITIHGIEVPKPMTEKPKFGDEYWFFRPGLSAPYNFIWFNDSRDNNFFKIGIFDNKEDCEAFAKVCFRPWQELAEDE